MKAHFFSALVCSVLVLTMTSCTKKSATPGGTDSTTDGSTDPHIVNPQLIGTWLWTDNSDGAYYDDNGTYNGSAYGLAREYKINADGSGTCFDHLYSTIGAGSGLEVNISSTGFFESDDQGHLGYFPLKGTYKSSSGTNRQLEGDELYNPKTGKGRVALFQKLVITKQGDRTCFQVTSSDGITDTYFKVQ